MKIKVLVMAAFALLGLSMMAQAITVDTVTVGNAGNAADITGFGAVSYTYNIGKYEVTAGQYAAFLNAKASTDTYGLYNTSMWSASWGCQIQRNGSSGSYTYSVASSYANRSVNYVSWYDTLRFANWLTNGQGSGDTESGSYTITGGGVNSGTVTMPTHASGTTAKWFLTSEDEWYKAAYYKGGGAYSLYANGTSAAPVAHVDSNYYNGSFLPPWDGSANGALDQNGTKDMMGNTWEWNEAQISESTRGMRGGGFGDTYPKLQSSYRFYSYAPTFEYDSIGFRLSQVSPVPEPSSILALLGGLAGLCGFAIRKRK